MRATLSLLGMYEYDHTILDFFNYPDKWEPLDRDVFLNKLLIDTAELEILYPDADIFKTAIKYWSAAEVQNWNKLYDTTVLKYNPIWNKDGTVTEIEKHVKNNNYTDVTDGTIADHSSTIGNQNTETSGNENTNGSQNTEASGNENIDTTNNTNEKDYVFGFNSESAAQSGQTVTDDSGSTNTDRSENTESHSSANTDRSENTQSNSSTNTDATTTNNTNFKHDEKENIDREYTRTEQGNIGITTTQQMINEEREVDKFNLMDYIIDRFKQRFCLLVY